jgi:hypothetical protein
LSAAFTDTVLKLDQNEKGEVPLDTIVVPDLIGPGTASQPFYTVREPMVFRAKGKTSDVRLMVTTNKAVTSGVVAPSTMSKLGASLNDRIEARRLTRFERVRNFGKAEVVLALIALLLVAAAIVTTLVTPSADQNVGRADLAIQLQPIEQRLAIGISTHNPMAVQQAQNQLRAALKAEGHASNDVSTGAMIATLVLGVVSAMFALGVAVKRAKKTV